MSITQPKKDLLKASIAIVGLNANLAADLVRALSLGSHAGTVRTVEQPAKSVRYAGADVIFCSSEPDRCLPVLEATRQLRLDIPVIVVSEHAAFDEWLNAMEAGASDYCMAPFDPMQLRWILASHVHCGQLAA